MPKLLVVEVGELPSELLDAIVPRVTRILGLEPAPTRPRLDPSFAYIESRKQYLASRLLLALRQDCDADSVVAGVAAVDLCNPVLTFVFGEAEMPGQAAVFSIYRLREEFYGLPPDPKLLAERAAKEMLHEIGHTFGMPHCLNPSCVMSSSHSVERVDLKRDVFCGLCRRLPSAASQ